VKRIGFIALSLVIALGVLGVGYAAWFDTLILRGTVETGDVDINIIDLSGTYVWKTDPYYCPVAEDIVEIYVEHGWMDEIGTPPVDPEPADAIDAFPNDGEADIDPVAYGIAWMDDQDPDGDTVMVEFANLFPCTPVTVDLLVQYDGSIPVHLVAQMDPAMDPEGILAQLYACGYITFNGYEYENGVKGAWIDHIDNIQLHEGDQIYVEMTIHIPQIHEEGHPFDQSELEGLGPLCFGVKVYAVQWNESDFWTPPAY
jgi:hypothetical protein